MKILLVQQMGMIGIVYLTLVDSVCVKYGLIKRSPGGFWVRPVFFFNLFYFSEHNKFINYV